MLNPFPTMWLSLLAFFILRLGIGLTLVSLGFRHLSYKRDVAVPLPMPARSTTLFFAIYEVVVGTLLVLGYHTQYAALAGLGLTGFVLFFRGRFPERFFSERIYYLLLMTALMSIFITGAGAFAFDLPL